MNFEVKVSGCFTPWCRPARATTAPAGCSPASAGSRISSPSDCTTEPVNPVPALLRPSTDAAGDRAELRRRLAGDGYLFFPGLLDARRVREAGADVMTVMRERDWLTAGPGPGRLRPLAPLPATFGPPWRELYVAVHHLESMHRLGFDRALQAAVTTLMGPDTFVLPRRIVRLIGPVGAGGPEVGASPHRDYEGFRIPDMLISWIPLVECPPGSGG